MVEYVAVHTVHGVTGLVPGQPVRCLGVDAPSGLLIVTDGTCQAKVDPTQLTADQATGQQVQARDQQSQDALWSAHQQAWERQQNQDRLDAIDEAARVQAVSSGLVNSVSDPLIDSAPLMAGIPDAIKRDDLLLYLLYSENLRAVHRRAGGGYTIEYEARGKDGERALDRRRRGCGDSVN